VRRFLLILLMIMLPWQALASTMDTLTHESENIIMHVAEHDLGIAHHHHDDGSSHHDNSETSRDHLSDHVCCPGAAILFSRSIDVLVFPAALAPPERVLPFLAGPDLEGRRRPPRTLA
jgi:ABC-type nickel/cobalt efflux system permease component RcnA